MKNIINKFTFFVALSFVFISCGNLTTSENDDSIPQGKGKITISTDLQNGRSVLPTAIKEDTTGLKWELFGVKAGEYKQIGYWEDDTDKTAYQKMVADTSLLVDTGTWDFTLTASNTDGKNVLSATISATINAGENKLNFVMQEATGDTAATGSIEFTLNFPKDVVDNVEAKLFKYENNDTEISNQTLFINSSSTDNCSFVKYSYPDATGTTSSPLSAGYYILKIELQQDTSVQATATDYQPINTYSCLIRVAPGLLSQGKYTLPDLAQLYTITYKLNEGTFDSTTSAVPTSYNAYTSFNLPTPTKAGYDFAGWYTDENLQKLVQLDESNKYKITQDTTLYAKWKISWDGLKQQIENDSGISEFVITEDLTATSTITVSKPFKITSDKNVTITRGNTTGNTSFTDAFFKVESAGNLELAGTEEKAITLDGGNASSTNDGGAVHVSGGTFTMNDGVTISNCNAKDGGAVYITNVGTFNMTGGTITGCSATLSGGGVWMNDSSSFTMSGDSKIEDCNSSSEGGGVYVTDVNNPCTFKMLDNATITGCEAVNGGGGIYLYGKLTMNDGTISGNEASNGAGVYVRDSSSFTMKGGTISDNKATVSGGGVYLSDSTSSFTMTDGAYVKSNNDVYLAGETTVTVAGYLTSNATPVATITPATCSVGTKVLTADDTSLLAQCVSKFALSDETYSIGSDGNIVASNQSSAISLTQAYLNDNFKKTNAYGESYYELEAGEYCVSANLTLEFPIQINAASGGEVKLYSNADYKISCAEGFDNSANSAMIALPMSAGTLILGGGEGTLTIDGSGISSLMYLVLSQSTLILQDNCTITNGNVTYTAIYVSAGTFTMTGGTITNIHSTKDASEGYGAGIHVLGSNTVVTVSGGSVCNNYNDGTNQGASIYSTNNSITVLGETIPKETLYTYNIVNSQQQNVSASLIEGAYYVSANGDDSNDGSTYDTPFKTLNKAITSANNSDSKTVYVIGTLNATSESSSASETVFFIAASVGTADSPINIIGYPDSDATLSALDDTGAANKRVFETDLESYIKMKDLILTGGNTSKSGAAIYYYDGELTLEDCKINGNKTTYSANSDSGIYYDGIYMYGSSNKLNMKNTECTDGIYLYNCTANFDDDCLLGYDDSTEIPIMHINNSSLNLGDVYFSNSIYSDAKSPICLTTSLTKHSNDEPIYIKLPNNVEGNQIISATSGVPLTEEVKKFTLSDTNYTISDDGKVVLNSGGGIAYNLPTRLTSIGQENNGSVGTSGEYVYFGEWPQTIKADDVVITEEKDDRGYYKGSDNYYYMKSEVLSYTDGLEYSNGKSVVDTDEDIDGDEIYFKVEPIKWRVITNSYNDDSSLLLCETILTGIDFYGDSYTNRTVNSTTINANNYKYSNVRAYLNSTKNQFEIDGGTANNSDIDWTGKGFYEIAFSEEAKNIILYTSVDNTLDSTNVTSNSYVCENTNDKIFLLSRKEASSYFGEIVDYYNESAIRYTTDYAKANLVAQDSNEYGGYWWLRSPYYDNSGKIYDTSDGGNYDDYGYCYSSYGIVPALCVKSENIK